MDLQQLEQFALADDRAQALEQLVPGTEDYYFHRCLVDEQAGDLEAVERTLEAWIDRHGRTAMVEQVRHRLALLRFPERPEQSLEHLKTELNLRFDHQRTVEGQQTEHPSAMDPSLLSRDAIRRRGLSRSRSGDLRGFTDAALRWLGGEPMKGERLRHVLGRISRPDRPGLVDQVLDELSDSRSGGFGSLPIHRRLLTEQLEQLAARRPELLGVEAFVETMLARLHPGPDVDWEHDRAEHEAYLERMWGFVQGLPPSHNPLKAHILYHRLELDRRHGVYDRARLMEYIALPRQVPYANDAYLRGFDRRGDQPFSIGQDFRGSTRHAGVGSDEALVRDYLSHLLLEQDDPSPFAPFIDQDFLDEVRATTMILAGIGDIERWTSMLGDPARFSALKERVELSFAAESRTTFGAEDDVSLVLDVKNVPTLVVRVFEINTLSYVLARGSEVDTSIDLDGLVASEEQTHQYAEPPLRRVRRTFDFPSLRGPGVYVVEFIGGGISSRALVRKGRLRYLERVGAAGHVFTILDEQQSHLTDATLWLGGREFRPGDDGTIVVPFSTRPSGQSIVLRHGELTTLESFAHQAERYQLSADFYVDRESLVRDARATVLVRARLEVNGVPTSLKLVEQPTLIIESTDHEGVDSRVEVPDFALLADRESTHELAVPEGVASLSLTLRGEVQNLSSGQTVDVEERRTFRLNGIDTDYVVDSLHMAHTDAGHVVYLLGRSGEPKAGVALNVRLQHRELVGPIDTTLQTDADGRIRLGPLKGVTSVQVFSPSGGQQQWAMTRDRADLPKSIHAQAGETIRIPYMAAGRLGELEPSDESPDLGDDVSLLEHRAGAFVRDRIDAVRHDDGFLEITGLEPGDYDLRLSRAEASIAVRVTEGQTHGAWIAGSVRQLERGAPRPLQIRGVETGPTDLEIRLEPTGRATRVHVFGTRFMPAYETFEGRPARPRWVRSSVAQSHYVSGRDIGDEYRYILERRRATISAGTMLARPGLLLAPWATRSTETDTQDASSGGGYAASAAPKPRAASAPAPSAQGMAMTADVGRANLDFLANPAVVRLNLRPDEDGVVRVPLEDLEHASQLRVVAVDAHHVVQRHVLRPEATTPHRDLRLRLGLDSRRHFTKQKQITVRSGGQPLSIADITTSKVEVYDTLERVFGLYASLSGDATLEKFRVVLRWPSADEAQKRTWYSELACHELNLFLSRKDPEFFAKVVAPHLRNKKHKTFLDHYLLEGDLSEYRRPWAYGRLNVVERILLAQRFDDELDPCARHIGDLDDLRPRDLGDEERLFRAALSSTGLETEDRLGYGAAAKEATEAKLATLAVSAAAPGAVMGGARRSRSRSKKRKSGSRGGDSMRMESGVRGEDPAELEEVDALFADEDDDMDFDEEGDGFGGGGAADLMARERRPSLYRSPDKTQEWAENDYYQRPVEEQGPDLVTVNPFWRDFAEHRHRGPFLSENLAHACGSFTEMMCALAVLDLPFTAEAPEVVFEDASMTMRGGTRQVVFHEEIKPTDAVDGESSILVAQHYLRHDDRYRHEGNEISDKLVTGEMLTGVIYVGKVVLTNPTSTTHKLEVLLQIPVGSVPLAGGARTRGHAVALAPQGTAALEYAFYFPRPGTFEHFPVHVARDEQLIAAASPRPLSVVREPSEIDRQTWAWVANNGRDEDVIAWLETHNIDRVSTDPNVPGLEQCAWRMARRPFYDRCLALLSARHIYDRLMWSYSVHHGDVPNIREFLLHEDGFLDGCGAELDSPLVRIEPVARHRYQHLEYAPLINARAHRLGARHEILNRRFAEQYRRLMGRLRYRASLDDDDRLAVAYYLLLQDRVAEGLAMLERVDAAAIHTTLQYDYVQVYAHFLREQPQAAREIAERYRDYPVDRWRLPFLDALAQLDELEGAQVQVVDPEDRAQEQTRLADAEPDFELSVEQGNIDVRYRNLSSITVNLYRMDIELLFSRQPFVQQQSQQFSFVTPNYSQVEALPSGEERRSVPLPDEYQGANVVVELVAGARRRSQAYFANTLSVQVSEGHGQLRVGTRDGGPVPRTYIKVYARLHGGAVKFYRDGYTDLRGRFDYASTSTDMLDRVERFAILVMSGEHGSLVREAAPPAR